MSVADIKARYECVSCIHSEIIDRIVTKLQAELGDVDRYQMGARVCKIKQIFEDESIKTTPEMEKKFGDEKVEWQKAKFEDESIATTSIIEGKIEDEKVEAEIQGEKECDEKAGNDEKDMAAVDDKVGNNEEDMKCGKVNSGNNEGDIKGGEEMVGNDKNDTNGVEAAVDLMEAHKTGSSVGDGELDLISDVAKATSEMNSNCEDEFEVRSYAQLNVSVDELREFFEMNMSSEEAKAKIEEEVSKVYRIYTDETEERIREEVAKVAESIYEKIGKMLSLRDTAIKNLQEDNDMLKNDIFALKEKYVALERKIELMAQDVISTKRNTFSNDQYLRQNNIEIDGIPKLEENQTLEGAVIDVLKQIDVKVSSDSFEACHRLLTSGNSGINDNGGTIICRFANQKICEKIHRNKSKFKNFPDNHSLSRIIIRDNINVYFKDLFAKCNILKQKKEINETWTYKGIPIVKLLNDEVKHITHSYDLERLFPDFNYSHDDSDL